MKKFFLRVARHEQGLAQARADLLAGRHRHDVLELDPADDSVGFGGFPDILGVMELDASFMDGDSRDFGAVAGVKNFLPVAVARRLMDKCIHTFLIGEGAEMFARESGLPPEPVLSDSQKQAWEKRVKPLLDQYGPGRLYDLVEKLAETEVRTADRNRDTTIMIANDGNGLSGAASTSGWPYKYPGRAGDTPVAGAGLYADSRYGGCACTYTGEMATRAGAARFVVDQLREGKSPEDAVKAAAEDIAALQGGVLRTLVIHAIDRAGREYVAAMNAAAPISYQYWHEDMPAPELRQAKRL